MKPIAVWNSARDVWEIPQTEGFFCEHLDVFLETFPTSGMTVNGAAYALPTWEPATDDSAYSSLLLTPVASEGEKATFQQGSAQRALTGQPFLTNQIRDVYDLNQPAPTSSKATTGECQATRVLMLPTPQAGLADKGGSQHPDKRRAGGHQVMLDDLAEHVLLPTPQAHDAQQGKTAEQVAAMRARGHGVSNLNETVENRLLPTPRAQHGEERNQNIYPRALDQPQNLENSLARLPGASTSQPSDAGNASLDGQLPGQLNLLDAMEDTD